MADGKHTGRSTSGTLMWATTIVLFCAVASGVVVASAAACESIAQSPQSQVAVAIEADVGHGLLPTKTGRNHWRRSHEEAALAQPVWRWQRRAAPDRASSRRARGHAFA